MSSETRWEELNPIFILGRQRTGTSIMWRALQVAGFIGFPEGHLWYDLVKPFAWWRNPNYKPFLKEELFTLGEGRDWLLEKRLALLLDRFHRDLLPPETVRWVSKSPGIDAVLVAPVLAEMFPQAQFIFMQRNAITTVHSTVEYIFNQYKKHSIEEEDADWAFRFTCEDWVQVMRVWRRVRPFLAQRYIEVAQEHIVLRPDEVAERVTDFLDIPQWSEAVAEVFKSRRENTAFPDKPVGEFFYPVDWTEEQKRTLIAICGSEMAVWGYPVDFQHPGGPEERAAPIASPDDEPPLANMEEYGRWLMAFDVGVRERELREEIQRYKDLLEQISQGRVLRTLNWLNRIVGKIKGGGG